MAIVGTRRPTPEASAFAATLASDLVGVGVPVCSGGAIGIDTAAHRGCLDAGGATLVVSPSSLDRPYPRENAALFDEIVERGGGIVSAYPPGTRAAFATFFERNAVLAALAHVVVVVESAIRGGARNAASAARRAGRPVLVVPGAPWNPRASGCIVELRNGAPLVTSFKDVLRRLPEPFASLASDRSVGSPARRTISTEQSPSEEARRVLGPEGHLIVSAIESGATHVDAVCAVSGLPIATVQAMLLTLTLQGILVSDRSGRLSLVSI